MTNNEIECPATHRLSNTNIQLTQSQRMTSVKMKNKKKMMATIGTIGTGANFF